MPNEREPKDRRTAPPDAPRTDLPPKKIPYDKDYFGTGEEEGVVEEREAPGEPGKPGKPGA